MGLYEEMIKSEKVPFLLTKELKVIVGNDAFFDLVNFSMEEIIGRDINEVLSMLRCNFNIEESYFENFKSYYLYNKFYEPIEVTIEVQKIGEEEVIYFIREVPNSRIEGRMLLFDHLFKDETIGMAVFFVPDIRLLKANETWLNFLDKPYNNKESTFGRRISEFISGWTGSTSEQIWRKVLQNGKSIHINEYKYPFKRGTTYWDTSLIPIYEEGSMKCVVEITKDITEKVMDRIIMEEQKRIIEAQKRQLEAIFENIQDMVSVVDKDGNYIRMFKKFYEYFQDEKISKFSDIYEFAEFYDLSGRRLSIDELPSYRVIRGDKFRDMKLHMKKGDVEAYFSVTGTPVYDESGCFQMGIMISNDITEEILRAKLIEEQKEKLNAIITNSSDGLVLLDKNKNMTLLNDAAKEFYYRPELIKNYKDIFLQTIYYDINGEIIPPERLVGERALKGEIVNDMRVVAKRPDKTLHVDINGSPIFDSKGELIGSLVSIRYLNEVIKYEEMLKKQRDELEQILKMKEEFFSFISHEFKTPLTVMSSIIQLLKLVYNNELSEKVMKYINKLNQSTLQQIRLVNNLLDITRGDSGYLKLNKKNGDIVSMTRVIADSVSNFAARKNIRIQFQTDISELIICIDDEKYERIILNLLSNAIKFTPEGRCIYINLTTDKDKVLISIRDEGVGIPEDKLGIIFDRFGQVNSSLTRQGEGTGIGLSLVKTLIHALGGSIKVESKIGVGSIFVIALPSFTIQENNNFPEELMDNRLVQSMDIEFSNIYFE
jgi:PAS domain S-box-containing protein